MAKIDDTGKVWFKGAFGPEYAIRVGDKVFVPGKEENDTVNCLVENSFLCVDLHNEKAGSRMGKYFSLNLPTTTPATLFNGFENTKHADVVVVTYKDEGVREVAVQGDVYREEEVSGMASEVFFQWLTDNCG